MNLSKLLLGTSLSLATFIGLSTKAIATNPQIFPQILVAQQANCKNPQTQTELNICSGLDYRRADQQLNQVYNQVRDQRSTIRRPEISPHQQPVLLDERLVSNFLCCDQGMQAYECSHT